MAGGLYLVQEAPDHEQYYTLGEEIITWSQPEELVDKVRFYTRNAAAAMRIREAGQRRVLREHTWERRFDRLFSLLRSQGKLA
jgi:spore maturation protein CgeB